MLVLPQCFTDSRTRSCPNICCIWPEQTKGFWQSEKAKKDILHELYVHQVLIKSLYLYQKEGKGRSIYGDKKGGKSHSEGNGNRQCSCWPREVTLAKANPKSLPAGMDWGVTGLPLPSYPISSVPGEDAYSPYVSALPLLLRLASHLGRKVLEGSLQTSGMFSRYRSHPHCLSCSWTWSSSLSWGALTPERHSQELLTAEKTSKAKEKRKSEYCSANNRESEEEAQSQQAS